MRVPSASNLRVLRAEPRFARLLAANLTSGTGDWFSTVAVLSLALQLTGSGLAVGITLAVRVVPRLVAGALAGVLADRFPRKRILIVTDLTSAGLALSFLLANAPDRVWVLYAGTVLLVLSSILNAPARSAVIPSLVLPENLLAANALSGAVEGSVILLGSLLGGLISGAFGPQTAFVVNALSFLLSAALVASIPMAPAAESAGRTPGASLRELLPLLRSAPAVPVIVLLATLWSVGGGVINVLVTVYGIQVFHAGNAGVGLLYGAIGAGILFGGLLARRIATGRERHMLALAIVFEGGFHALLSQVPSLALGMLFLLLSTLGAGVGNACSSYLLMRSTPDALLGRVFALLATVSGVTFSGSLFLSGLLLAVIPPRTLGLAGGLLIAATGLVGIVLLRRVPAPVPVPASALAAGVESRPSHAPVADRN
ncbi:MAG TPA: MFS transporter [Ktedonobacterales bacterium]|nr:MFS transporter [Ktedonobacterales bacterium]